MASAAIPIVVMPMIRATNVLIVLSPKTRTPDAYPSTQLFVSRQGGMVPEPTSTALGVVVVGLPPMLSIWPRTSV